MTGPTTHRTRMPPKVSGSGRYLVIGTLSTGTHYELWEQRFRTRRRQPRRDVRCGLRPGCSRLSWQCSDSVSWPPGLLRHRSIPNCPAAPPQPVRRCPNCSPRARGNTRSPRYPTTSPRSPVSSLLWNRHRTAPLARCTQAAAAPPRGETTAPARTSAWPARRTTWDTTCCATRPRRGSRWVHRCAEHSTSAFPRTCTRRAGSTRRVPREPASWPPGSTRPGWW